MSDYLNWQSDLTVEHVFAEGESFSYPTLLDDGMVYLSTLKSEGSRQALIYRKGEHVKCLTPVLYDLRTKISEYGGKPYWYLEGEIYFANNRDQCLYRQTFDAATASEPTLLTKKEPDGELMYTDLLQVEDNTLVAIVEQQNVGAQNNTFLAEISVTGDPVRPQAIQSGADFYSNLVIDRSHRKMAWVQWMHPNMPWDSTELWLADYSLNGGKLQLSNQQKVVMDKSAAVCQLIFSASGRLFFAVDFADCKSDDPKNYWNIYALDADFEVQNVTSLTKEFGYPHWQYGDVRIVQYDDESLLAIASDATHDELYLIDQDSLAIRSFFDFDGHVQHLCSDSRGTIALVKHGNSSGPQLLKFDCQCPQPTMVITNSEPLKSADISQARHISYPCADGGEAFGFYYAPANARYQNEGAPPLLVMVHGGPTARSYGYFDIQKQFWTNRGFAIFDVNHRGSCGYGRQYRDALYGEWGMIDASDIADGIEYLTQRDLAKRDQICIRGKSAGGYAVLRVLCTYPELFRAGACYYGIGNLATLAEITHKFEKHYTDRLLGEAYRPEYSVKESSRYYQRSPIHQISQVRSAMIIFQGLLDNVVPPAVAQEVVSVLKSSGIKHRYIEYADEGHGFRQVKNNIDAWTQELEFYREILVS